MLLFILLVINSVFYFQASDEIMKEKPELGDLIMPKIMELSQQFDDLERTTKEKGERLFDANRQVISSYWYKFLLLVIVVVRFKSEHKLKFAIQLKPEIITLRNKTKCFNMSTVVIGPLYEMCMRYETIVVCYCMV